MHPWLQDVQCKDNTKNIAYEYEYTCWDSTIVQKR